jgi:hypothetical protein
MLVLALWLALLLGGPANAQEVSQSDAEAHARLQERLTQTQQALAQYFFLPEAQIPPEVLGELERLNSDIDASYFRDLADRSRMLLFVTREQAALQQKRAIGAEIGAQLRKEAKVERRGRNWRKGSAAVFWGFLGTGLLSFGGSFGLWYASERLDRRYLASTSLQEAALLKAWSRVLDAGSYVLAGMGTVSLVIAMPALAGSRPR